MYQDKKVIVVMPAYNAAETLEKTHAEVMDQGIVDHVIVVDDCSSDNTSAIAEALPHTTVYRHETNTGYGGNQKSCYRLALEMEGDIVIMVHPDYQYTPQLIPAMASMIGNGLYHCVLGSRILGGHAVRSGMPLWKYIANRGLTMSENILFRAFSREVLERLPLDENSDDFVFDNQMLAQVLWWDYVIAEVSCPTKYFAEASSINLQRSIVYGFGCLGTALSYRMCKIGILNLKRFPSLMD